LLEPGYPDSAVSNYEDFVKRHYIEHHHHHRAVLVLGVSNNYCPPVQQHLKFVVYDRIPKYINDLCTALENYSWARQLKATQFSTNTLSYYFAPFPKYSVR